MPIRNADTISEIGCVPCLLTNLRTHPGDIHHPFGRKGENNHRVYCLCPFLHRGLIPEGWTNQTMMGMFGPSLAWGKTPYERYFGPEESLLKVQDFLVQEFVRSPWMNYSTPNTIRHLAIDLWKRERN